MIVVFQPYFCKQKTINCEQKLHEKIIISVIRFISH